MPYTNEHSARIKSPGTFDKFRRVNDAFGSGIHVIYGIKNGKSEVQAIRFDKDKFNAVDAKKWLSDHDKEYLSFEAAKKEESIEVYKSIFVECEGGNCSCEKSTEECKCEISGTKECPCQQTQMKKNKILCQNNLCETCPEDSHPSGGRCITKSGSRLAHRCDKGYTWDPDKRDCIRITKD
jgi:hypothetical protein